MRLHDIISSSLLPRFAEDAEWEQNALDVFVKAVRALSFGLGAPYTRKAISALTDADLQAYFLSYGIISYYPELSRQTRENMLFELARMYRFLGTPYAITALCRYIFDESDAVEVEVKDNLAFDDDGELIDASLLDLFDIAIDAQSASIGGSAGDRIVANVLKIARNSQALRNIYFRYEDEVQIPVRCADYIGFSYRIGDDYELSRPVTPAPSYEEITLYAQASSIAQPTVSSKFVENVTSSCCAALFADSGFHTIWNGYSYSNDYQVGVIIDGEWVRLIDSVSGLPNSTTTVLGNVKFAYVLLDTGYLWVCDNYASTATLPIPYTTFVVRIYPKDQQYYAGYFKYNNLYTNYSLAASRPLYPWPYGTSANYKAWFSSYPTASFVKFLGSAMNELSNVGNVSLSRDSSNALTVTRTGYSGSINVRCVIYTLNTPTFYAWVRSDKSETPVFNNADYTLYDSSGAPIPYDSSVSYKAIGIFIASGANCANERNVIAGSAITNVNGNLAFRKVSGVGVTASKIWYIKTPIV